MQSFAAKIKGARIGPVADKPNLIFILADRLRRDAMAAYGSDWLMSPSLEALAAESFVFERAYVTQPVCAPSRASLLTGLYPQASGVRINGDDLPPEVPVITEMISDEYRTGYFGKWHLGDDFTRQRGFDEWVSVKAWMMQWTDEENAETRSDYYAYLFDRGLSPPEDVRRDRLLANAHRASLDAEHQMAPYLGDRAAEFIEADDDRAFILFVSCVEPHPPFDGPYNDLYATPTRYPDGESYLQASAYHSSRLSPRCSQSSTRIRCAMDSTSPNDAELAPAACQLLRKRASSSTTWSARSSMRSDRSGKADDTVIVFTSEHGEMLGSHALLELRRPYEETAGVPLIDQGAVARRRRGAR